MLPKSTMPNDIFQALHHVGAIWAASPARPRIATASKRHWDLLLDEWARSDLPIIARRSGPRGDPIVHASGRTIILADNSPSQWAFANAYAALKYSVDDIRQVLAADLLPFAMALKGSEKRNSRFKCTLPSVDNVNASGWKLCHIDHVGLKSRVATAALPLERLIDHFCLLLRPSNHFVVPVKWSGMGEIPEVIAEVRAFEAAADAAFEGRDRA